MTEDPRTAAFLRMIRDLDDRHLVGTAGVREVWLIRHADAYGGLQSLAEGTIDPPLSALGRDQAQRLAERLARVPVHAVWASDLRRARETAETLARRLPLEVRIDARLREVRTFWDEGRDREPPPPGTYPFPEPEAEVVERMQAVVADVAGALDGVRSPVPRAAVVTHNGAIAMYVAALLGMRWGQLRLLPLFTSVSVVALRGDRAVVRSIGDVTHLAE